MAKLNVLDKKIYNQISAGEVVERPFSVCKELIENSIDAGAKNISVSIINGGKSYIEVTDDGFGMEKDDLVLSIMPHATSKISSVSDLDVIKTLGFRGEALASIGAVSKLTISSIFVGQNQGYSITTIGG
ncbi:MAG: ATP-binding protein, partial [Clostridia bacterium]|nr:ATP-binding protein [Clostridia bacterium]